MRPEPPSPKAVVDSIIARKVEERDWTRGQPDAKYSRDLLVCSDFASWRDFDEDPGARDRHRRAQSLEIGGVDSHEWDDDDDEPDGTDNLSYDCGHEMDEADLY